MKQQHASWDGVIFRFDIVEKIVKINNKIKIVRQNVSIWQITCNLRIPRNKISKIVLARFRYSLTKYGGYPTIW